MISDCTDIFAANCIFLSSLKIFSDNLKNADAPAAIANKGVAADANEIEITDINQSSKLTALESGKIAITRGQNNNILSVYSADLTEELCQKDFIKCGSVDLDFKGAIKYSRSVAENYSELLSQAKKIKKFAKKGQKDEIKGKMAQMIQKKQLFFYFSAFYKVWARTLGATHPNLRY